jgi:drug/metabolite transporter (DMT)-like permease
MDDGFVLGTLSAITWGLADVLVTYVSRRGGFFKTLLLSQIFGLALLVVVALALDDLPGPSTAQLLALVALGPVAVAAYAGFYRALELGPIAIVSPIASANGAVVVLLAVLVLDESLTAVQALGCMLVLGFIVLAAREPSSAPGEGNGNGIRLALIASIAFGGYLFVLATMSDELGWLVPILIARSVTVAIVCAVAVARPPPSPGALGRLGVLGCVGAGLLDACGYLVYNRGAEIGEVAITSAAASAYPVIPILVGLFALRERIAWHQLVGVGGVLCGMVVLSLG